MQRQMYADAMTDHEMAVYAPQQYSSLPVSPLQRASSSPLTLQLRVLVRFPPLHSDQPDQQDQLPSWETSGRPPAQEMLVVSNKKPCQRGGQYSKSHVDLWSSGVSWQ